MRSVCAWCGVVLRASGNQADAAEPITHGICRACADALLADLTAPLDSSLERLAAPILVVDSDVTVIGANSQALAALAKPLEEVTGQRGGDVIGCQWSHQPGGCGRQVCCRTCAIRRTVSDTHSTGVARKAVPAYTDVVTPAGPRRLNLLISTEKLGDLVLLRIDELGLADEPDPA